MIVISKPMKIQGQTKDKVITQEHSSNTVQEGLFQTLLFDMGHTYATDRQILQITECVDLPTVL